MYQALSPYADLIAIHDLLRADELIRLAIETCREVGLGPGSRERRLLDGLGDTARLE